MPKKSNAWVVVLFVSFISLYPELTNSVSAHACISFYSGRIYRLMGKTLPGAAVEVHAMYSEGTVSTFLH